ncbi:MAG: transcription termination/antitermination protein NusG, partial [Actinobacteria bacterium]|nr:transcription termination/antitermination protein NusG [Actinomycetota bacterium]
MSIETPANPPVDAFEAALAVNESAPVIEESITPVIDDVVSESVTEENDENAEFRAA